MLDHPDNNNIYTHNYDQDWLPIFMLAFWLFIIKISTRVYLEVIAKIQG